MSFSEDSAERKQFKLHQVLRYFPNALARVGDVIEIGQKQHKVTAWDRSKSTDHLDSLLRHVVDAGTNDTDGVEHLAKVAWRALAALQVELERKHGLPISPGSVEPRQTTNAVAEQHYESHWLAEVGPHRGPSK